MGLSLIHIYPRRAHHLHYGAHADQRSGRGGAYTGAAYEGIAFLPWVGAKLNPVLKPLFGFTSPEAIAVPVTALGAAGASIGLILPMIRSGLAVGNDIAVFTAMCMCWSGYLSTHVAVSYTHLDVYKRQSVSFLMWIFSSAQKILHD